MLPSPTLVGYRPKAAGSLVQEATAVIAAIVAVLAAVISVLQIFVTRFISNGVLFQSVVARLQSEDIRALRKHLYSLSGKPFEDWTRDDFDVADRLCVEYSQVGFLLKNSYIPVARIVSATRWIVSDCFIIAEPYIQLRREREARPTLFLEFEWFARSEYLILQRKQWYERKSWAHLRAKTQGMSLSRRITSLGSDEA